MSPSPLDPSEELSTEETCAAKPSPFSARVVAWKAARLALSRAWASWTSAGSAARTTSITRSLGGEIAMSDPLKAEAGISFAGQGDVREAESHPCRLPG
jgi:hypothetical protein